MSALGFYAKMANQIFETIALQARKHLAAEPDRAELFAAKCVAQPGKFFPQETIVKAGIVCHKDGTFRKFNNIFGDLMKARRLSHHFLRNTGDLGNPIRDVTFGIDQR